MPFTSRPIIKNLLFYQNTGQPFIVIAHRGSSSEFPENTLSAFEGAVAMKADMIELDIQLSKDGIPMVFHDDSIERCTNGSGRLQEYTAAELKNLDAGRWKSNAFSGEEIPTLDEVLAFANGRISVNIEIKSHQDVSQTGIEQQALELVKKHNMEKYVLFSCFNPDILVKLRKLSGSIPLALLYERNNHPNRLPIDLITKYDINAFNCSQWHVRKRWIKELGRHDIPVLVYTVNSKWLMKKFIKNGVKGIFTNKPDELRRQLEIFYE